jgi:poly(A) polymerase
MNKTKTAAKDETEHREPVVLSRSEHSISRRDLDPDALKVMYRLYRNGFKTYLVGGAVRDLLLGKTPKDFDVVTDAHPGQVKKLFSNCMLIGRRFRLAHIRFKGGKVIEVATFRKEPEEAADQQPEAQALPEGHAGEEHVLVEQPRLEQEHGEPGGEEHAPAEGERHHRSKRAHADHNISFGTPCEDAFRRDLTINALFYDISNFSIIDYVGGLEDMAQRRVCVIGNPHERYVEDPVRMWRVLRHAARLDFTIEKETAAAILRDRDLLCSCSGARLFEELNKDLSSGNLGPVFQALHDYGLLASLFGKIGRVLQEDPEAWGALRRNLVLVDEETRSGRPLAPEVVLTLLFWPWAEKVLGEGMSEGVDVHDALHDELQDAGIVITVPKAMRASIVQVLSIVERMFIAMRTGRMRWSLKKRSHYKDASAIFPLLYKGEATDMADPFGRMFREAHPGSSGPWNKKRPRWRGRRRRKGKGTGPEQGVQA